jgi:hypothetical protein
MLAQDTVLEATVRSVTLAVTDVVAVNIGAWHAVAGGHTVISSRMHMRILTLGISRMLGIEFFSIWL